VLAAQRIPLHSVHYVSQKANNVQLPAVNGVNGSGNGLSGLGGGPRIAGTGLSRPVRRPGDSLRQGMGGKSSAVASAANLRPSAVHDDDDVEDILQQVRKDVAAIQNAADQDPSACTPRRPHQSLQGMRPLSRSFSEATWDRPKTREREGEDKLRALPKATVKGRYVFSGDAEKQVLDKHHAARATRASGASYDLLPDLASQFTPRPTGRSGETREHPAWQHPDVNMQGAEDAEDLGM